MTTSSPATSSSQSAGRLPDGFSIRPFDGEYAQLIAIQNEIDPDDAGNEESWRFRDQNWRHDRFYHERLVAAAPNGEVVGWAQVFHMPWQFHPDKYRVHVEVRPSVQGQGIGSALFAEVMQRAQARKGIVVRTDTQESRTTAVAVLEHWGFGEIQRYWESRLDVPSFDFAAFSTAEERAASQGITLTTLARELAEHGEDETMLRAIYEAENAAFLDVPFPDPATSIEWDEWRKWVLEAPNRLPDAFFLAKDGDRYAGVSNLNRKPEQPDVIFQGFTGVVPAYRGKGVAMALKMQTVKYARDNGYREIRTGNNTRNRPMLRINEAMGFVKQPVWIEYEKTI
jgi:GNAT superfamily N-acetyltransferase